MMRFIFKQADIKWKFEYQIKYASSLTFLHAYLTQEKIKSTDVKS